MPSKREDLKDMTVCFSTSAYVLVAIVRSFNSAVYFLLCPPFHENLDEKDTDRRLPGIDSCTFASPASTRLNLLTLAAQHSLTGKRHWNS